MRTRDAVEPRVWLVELDRLAGPLRPLVSALSPEERQRAARIADGRLRARWQAAHAALRLVLARRLTLPPAAIAFAYGRWGKPVLARGGQDIAFSLAHSGSWAAIAVAPGPAVGVDIEVVRPIADPAPLAAALLTAAERRRLLGLAPAARNHALLTAWTRHEAQRKATGLGLDDGPGGLAGASAIARHVHDLALPPGLVGALALPNPAGRVVIEPLDPATALPA